MLQGGHTELFMGGCDKLSQVHEVNVRQTCNNRAITGIIASERKFKTPFYFTFTCDYPF